MVASFVHCLVLLSVFGVREEEDGKRGWKALGRVVGKDGRGREGRREGKRGGEGEGEGGRKIPL